MHTTAKLPLCTKPLPTKNSWKRGIFGQQTHWFPLFFQKKCVSVWNLHNISFVWLCASCLNLTTNETVPKCTGIFGEVISFWCSFKPILCTDWTPNLKSDLLASLPNQCCSDSSEWMHVHAAMGHQQSQKLDTQSEIGIALLCNIVKPATSHSLALCNKAWWNFPFSDCTNCISVSVEGFKNNDTEPEIQWRKMMIGQLVWEKHFWATTTFLGEQGIT